MKSHVLKQLIKTSQNSKYFRSMASISNLLFSSLLESYKISIKLAKTSNYRKMEQNNPAGPLFYISYLSMINSKSSATTKTTS